MPNYAKFNYYNLINLKPKSFLIGLNVLIFIILVFVYINNFLYSFQEMDAIYEDGYLLIENNNNNSDTIIKGKYLVINNQKENYEIIQIYNNDQNKIIYKLKINSTYTNKQIINLKIYYKQRIINVKKVFT